MVNIGKLNGKILEVKVLLILMSVFTQIKLLNQISLEDRTSLGTLLERHSLNFPAMVSGLMQLIIYSSENLAKSKQELSIVLQKEDLLINLMSFSSTW